PLVGIDLRNSQPLLFGLVLRALSHNGGRMPEWLASATEERDVGYLDLSQAATTERADEEETDTTERADEKEADEETPTTHKDTPNSPTGKNSDKGRGTKSFIMTELSGLNTGPGSIETPCEVQTYGVASTNVYLSRGLHSYEATGDYFASQEDVETYV